MTKQELEDLVSRLPDGELTREEIEARLSLQLWLLSTPSQEKSEDFLQLGKVCFFCAMDKDEKDLVNGLAASICHECLDTCWEIAAGVVPRFPDDYCFSTDARHAIDDARDEAARRNLWITPLLLARSLLREHYGNNKLSAILKSVRKHAPIMRAIEAGIVEEATYEEEEE